MAGFDSDLVRSSTETLVLSVLADGAKYGYQILALLRERSAGRLDLAAGTLYPILHKLERAGCVRSRWDDSTGRNRKWYALTDKGRRRLENDAREWMSYVTCVREILQPVLGGNGGTTPALSGA